MYRLTPYGLAAAVISIILSLFELVPYDAPRLLLSLAITTSVSVGLSHLLARLFRSPNNPESALVTALILFCLMAPPGDVKGALVLTGTVAFGAISKYFIAFRKKHLFNPAAAGAAFSSLALGSLGGGAIWWVASPVLLPVIAVVGYVILKKIRRFTLFFTFAGAAALTILIVGASIPGYLTWASLPAILWQTIASWPIVFFGAIMLTEPLTLPPTRRAQIIYGLLVGMLFGSPFHLGPIYATPENALLIGNIFSWLISPKNQAAPPTQRAPETDP